MMSFSAVVEMICWLLLLSSLKLNCGVIGVQAYMPTTTIAAINHHHHQYYIHPPKRKGTFIAQTSTKSSSRILSSKPKLHDPVIKRRRTRNSPVLLFSNNGDNNDDEDNNHNNNDFHWMLRRFERAEKFEIIGDAILVSCFVLLRFFIYDITTGTKIVPGWDVQDIIWLTGTFSSSTVLIFYWTIAGLLSRSFEISNYSPMQVFVNVALCCPIWIATEHLLEFGPSDIGGTTLSEAITTGFVSLATFMVIARNLTAGWKR